LVLKIEDIIHSAIVPFGPDVCAGGCIDELSGNAYPRARLPHAALEDIANVESFCDLAHINVLTLELEGRCPRCNEEPAQPRQSCDELLDNAVGKIFLLRVATHVLKGQDCNRGLLGQSWSRNSRWAASLLQLINPHRLGDIFQLVLASVPKRRVKLAMDLPESVF